MHGYEIVSQVLDKFRGLPVKMARLFGKTSEWWSSHGRKPQRLDEYGTGKLSPVDHYLEFVDQYGACDPDAGKLLNQLVYAEAKCRLTGDLSDDCTQRELRYTGLKEATEALQAIDKCDFHKASKEDFTLMNFELAGLAVWVDKAQQRINRELQKREIKEDNKL